MVHTRSDRGFGTRGQETGAQVRRAGVELVEETPVRWRIERHGAMRVPGIVFASRALLPEVVEDRSMEQVVNVATLPGIVVASYAMPDVHWGYGFPIGGVAATDIEQGGVVSPGGVGFDISCGVRLLGSELHQADLPGCLPALMDQLAARIPKGMGRGAVRRLRGDAELDQVLAGGARWAVEQGAGGARDLDRCEDHGAVGDADPAQVSQRAHQRGMGQLGSLGSGNHFLEVQVVDAVHDQAVAAAFGLQAGQVTVMIHCGSRGLGHQICTDHVHTMLAAMGRHQIQVPDRQLACAPVDSPEGQAYLGAMAAAANYGRANRHLLAEATRDAFARVTGHRRLELVYDVSHNLAKLETHQVDGQPRRLCVHRKGATRALPPGHPDLPADLADAGQPVLIPGSMGTASWVLAGVPGGGAFWSTCHGAGRRMSRHPARRQVRGQQLRAELAEAGIEVRADSDRGLTEETPAAYKDVDEVVATCERAGLARPIARLRPVGVIKG
jgi:tRNA-splicing ligase RtcB